MGAGFLLMDAAVLLIGAALLLVVAALLMIGAVQEQRRIVIEYLLNQGHIQRNINETYTLDSHLPDMATNALQHTKPYPPVHNNSPSLWPS